jgi:hypothetical protein
VCGVRSVVCGILILALCDSVAVCGSARGCVRLSDSVRGSVRQPVSALCSSVRLSGSARQCAAVWQCTAVRADVCGSARRCAAVHVAVCGSARGGVWQCLRQCAAVWQCAR